jgi:hypothetical protein
MSTSAMLILGGVVCLALGGFTIYKTMPREGKPPTAWTSTETRATGMAMLVLVFLLAGVTMLLKGIF